MNSRKHNLQTEPSSPWQPLQFRLSTLFWVLTMFAGLLTIMVSIGLMWSFALGLLIVMILGHIAGNSIGTRLRNHTSKNLAKHSAPQKPRSEASVNWTPPAATRLQQKKSMGRWMLLAAILGAIVGGHLGNLWILALYADRISPAAIAVGIFAVAVLGAFAAFFATCLILLILRSWREMVREHDARK